MPETKTNILTMEDMQEIFLGSEMRFPGTRCIISSRTDLYYAESERAIAAISITRFVQRLMRGGTRTYFQTAYLPTAQALKLQLAGNGGLVPNRPIITQVDTLEEAYLEYDKIVSQDWVV